MNLLMIGRNPIFKGTFLQELLEVINAQEFIEIIGEPAADEKVIGEMNDLEKALYTLCIRYEEKAKILLWKDSEAKDLLSQEVEFQKIKGRFKIAHNWLWSSIEERFAGRRKIAVTGHSICSGYKVVQTSNKFPKSSFLSILLY